MATKLRDVAKELGYDVGWNAKTGQVKVGDLTFQSGQGSQYGLSFDPTGTHYVDDIGKLRQALGISEPATPPPAQAPAQREMPSYTPPQYDYTQSIDDLYERERQARLLSLQNQLRGQTDALDRQRAGLDPLFQQERVQTDTSSQLAGRRLAEVMANRGLASSGENITATAGLEAARQQAMSNIGQQETSAHRDIDQRISDLSVANLGDIAQMEAALGSERARATLEDQYRQQDFGYRQYQDELANYWKGLGFDYQRERDTVGDERYEREWGWQTDPTNPAYQQQMLNLEISRMQAEVMPEQMKLQLEQLKQDLALGKINAETASEQLSRLKRGLPINPTVSGGGGGTAIAPTSPLGSFSDITKSMENMFKRDYYEQTDTRGNKIFDSEARTRDIAEYIANLASSGMIDQETLNALAVHYGFATQGPSAGQQSSGTLPRGPLGPVPTGPIDIWGNVPSWRLPGLGGNAQ